MRTACFIRVRGVVQGVGFRPFVYRLARANSLGGWVLNGEQGVEIYVEGLESSIANFVRELKDQPPPAAVIAQLEVSSAASAVFHDYDIHRSQRTDRPPLPFSPVLVFCDSCFRDLFEPSIS